MTIAADARRLVLSLPLFLLAFAAAASVLVVAARLVAGPGRTLSGAAEACARIGPLCALAYIYVRFVYVARTKLVIDRDGAHFVQPLGQWRIAWAAATAIEEHGLLTPAQRGGIGAGVTLRLRGGEKRVIPDVLALPRSKLCLLLSRIRASG